jgi:hypothetical protein
MSSQRQDVIGRCRKGTSAVFFRINLSLGEERETDEGSRFHCDAGNRKTSIRCEQSFFQHSADLGHQTFAACEAEGGGVMRIGGNALLSERAGGLKRYCKYGRAGGKAARPSRAFSGVKHLRARPGRMLRGCGTVYQPCPQHPAYYLRLA